MAFPEDNSFPDTNIRPDGTALPDGRMISNGQINKLIFDEVLKQDFIKNLFNENTLASVIQDHFNHVAIIDQDISKIKMEAPDFEQALTMWIEKIENDLTNAGYRFDLEEGINMISKAAYEDKARGIPAPLYSYTGLIFTGYFTFMRRLNFTLPNSTGIVNDELFIEHFKKGIEYISYGAALAIKLPQLKNELKELRARSDFKVSYVEPIFEKDLIEVKSAGLKYALLHELGVIDFLQERFNLINAKQALLLAYITDKNLRDSFKTLLSQAGTKESEHYPFKPANLLKVGHILAEIGIERKTKPDK